MFLSPRTFDGYLDTLFGKLKVASSVGLVIFAIRNEIVKLQLLVLLRNVGLLLYFFQIFNRLIYSYLQFIIMYKKAPTQGMGFSYIEKLNLLHNLPHFPPTQ